MNPHLRTQLSTDTNLASTLHQKHVDVITQYLTDNSPTWPKLRELKEKLWKDPRGDEFFEKQRNAADTADAGQQKRFFEMMQIIGKQLQKDCAALRLKGEAPLVLDTCIAPGGFAQVILDLNPSAKIYAITLPERLGGHATWIKHGSDDERVEINFTDITTLGIEFGLQPKQIKADLSSDTLYPGKQFSLVVCDGQLLRTNKSHRITDLENFAAEKLKYSQLIFGMNRLCDGGTLIILLHRVETWKSIQLLSTFSGFAKIQLFKHKNYHSARSSFYLVAKDVRSESSEAHAAIARWKEMWRQCHFGPNEMYDDVFRTGPAAVQIVEDTLQHFGTQFISLAEPIWSIQMHGLEQAPWCKK